MIIFIEQQITVFQGPPWFSLCQANIFKKFLYMILNIRQCLPYSMLWSKQGCCCSVAKPCMTICDPMNCSTPGFPVLHYLQEFAQIHDHWVAAAIQSSHPLLPHSPPVLNLSQHQGLFQWVGFSHQALKYWSFSFSSLQSKGLSRILSSTTIWKASVLWRSAFFMVQLSHPYLTPGKNTALTIWRARRSNQSMLKEINPKYSLEGLMLKLKLQHFGHLMWTVDSQEKTLMLEKIRGQEKWATEMRWFDGIIDSMDMSLSKLQEINEQQGSLEGCSLWGCRVRYDLVTEQQPLSANWCLCFFKTV